MYSGAIQKGGLTLPRGDTGQGKARQGRVRLEPRQELGSWGRELRLYMVYIAYDGYRVYRGDGVCCAVVQAAQ